MILYSVNCKSPVTGFEGSIVTIHKSLEGAMKAKDQYALNCLRNKLDDWEYSIIKIDTDQNDDIIYDCDDISPLNIIK